MLPADFQWIPRGQYAQGELALTVEGRWVAQLMRKVDGVSWYAILYTGPGTLRPFVTRDCASKESGVAGIEAWACRHEATLRKNQHLYAQAESDD